MKNLTAVLAVLVWVAGCCSINTANQGGRTMCVVSNYGWRLFDMVPIVSGNPDTPDESGCRWFTDTITLENNQKLLDRAIHRMGASGVRFQNSYMTDEQTLFTFYRRTYYTSAELVFDSPIKAQSKMAETAPSEKGCVK